MSKFKVGDVVGVIDPEKFRAYWNNRQSQSNDVVGDFEAEQFTITETDGTNGYKLKELSFGGPWFVESWFYKIEEKDMKKKEAPKEEKKETIKLKDLPLGRIAKVHDSLYVAKFISTEVLRIWLPNKDNGNQGSIESLDGVVVNWDLELLPLGATISFVFNGEKDWQEV